jgi:hypothetical protein
MVTWEGVSGITSYEVNYGVSTEPMSWNSWIPTPLNQNYGGPITGLTARTWYKLRVRQHTGANASLWSSLDDFFTIPVPNNVVWNGSTLNTASITWESVNMGGGVICSSYEVSWGLTTEAVGSGDAMTNNVNYTLTGLTTGQTYYVKVRARDDTNSGWSDWAPYPYLTVTATDQATVSGIDVTSGWRGTTVKITGQNFGATTGTVSFGATAAQVGYWTNSEIAVSVPPNAVAGSNAIIVMTATGYTATHVPSAYSFNVTNGGFVLDDFEGGVWQYATWESGPSRSVAITKNYTSAPERNTYLTAECAGSAAYEIVGGVSTYGDLTTEAGYDLSPYTTIKLWFKGNGSSNVATFELVESNTATGNLGVPSSAAEVWKYNMPISMSGTGWQQITINLTTEGASKFVRDDTWWPGNNQLDLNKIKSYQILTTGSSGNPKSYALDYIYATSGGVVSNIFITREADAPGSNIRITWEATSNVDIWTKTATFETNPASWTKEYSSVSGTSQVDSSVSGKVGSGTTKWYKIMPTGVALTTADLTQEVLGKCDYSLAVGSNMISLPFIPFGISHNAVIGNQLTGGTPVNGDKIYAYVNGAWYNSYLNASGVWVGSLSTVEADRGYWIKIEAANAAKTISIVGKTCSGNRTIVIHSGSNFIGNAYPVSVLTNNLGLIAGIGFTEGSPATADKIYTYLPGYISTYLSSTTHLWQSGTLTSFSPGLGYYVNKQAAGDVVWTYTKPY